MGAGADTAPPEAADVVIVGGGPAGSVAATALRRRLPGLSVVVVDRATFPRDKSCGDAISPSGLRLLHDLGLGDAVAGYPLNGHYRVQGPNGIRVSGGAPGDSDEPFEGVVVPREVFDHRLLVSAAAAGAHVVLGWTFVRSELEPDGGRAVVLARDGVEHRLRTRLLVGADGASSRVRRDLGVPPAPTRAVAVALRGYVAYRATEPDPPIDFEFEPRLLPAYAWFFPITDALANIGVGMAATALRRQGSGDFLQRSLDAYVVRLRGRGLRVEAPERLRTHKLPHARDLPPLHHPAAALIGDAASMINPFSGEGIAYGMHAGAMLAGALDEGFPSTLSSALERFETAYRERFGAHFRTAVIAQRTVSRRRLANTMFRRAAASAPVRDAFVRMLFDEGRIDATLVRALAGRPRRC